MRGKDYTGLKAGRLIAICRTERKTPSRSWIWKFKCECGGETEARVVDVKKGHTKSCGCLQREAAAKEKFKHGLDGTRLNSIWKNMRNRCTNKNNPAYERYGGRDITVCAEWQDFTNFRNWAMRNGYQEHLTIDRIDNNKGYTPSNCRWATMQEQQSNRRNTRVIKVLNERFTLKEISEMTGISHSTLSNRRYRKQKLMSDKEYDEMIKRIESKGVKNG